MGVGDGRGVGLFQVDAGAHDRSVGLNGMV